MTGNVTLVSQVNQAFSDLESTRKILRELAEMDTSRMESPQIRAIEKETRKYQIKEEQALAEIERLKWIIQATLADTKYLWQPSESSHE